MEPFPLKTNQAALGAEGFLGLAVPCQQSAWRSLVSLPLYASAACASPGHEASASVPQAGVRWPFHGRACARSFWVLQLEASAANWYQHCFPDTAGCDV